MTRRFRSSTAAAILAAAGPTLSVVEAGAVLGMSRSFSYEAARAGRFPVAVLKLGRQRRVSTAALRRLLDLPVETTEVAAS